MNHNYGIGEDTGHLDLGYGHQHHKGYNHGHHAMEETM